LHYIVKKLINHSGTVVPNHYSEDCMRIPNTFCAALKRFSIKSLIFCVTDFVLQWKKRFNHSRAVSIDLC